MKTKLFNRNKLAERQHKSAFQEIQLAYIKSRESVETVNSIKLTAAFLHYDKVLNKYVSDFFSNLSTDQSDNDALYDFLNAEWKKTVVRANAFKKKLNLQANAFEVLVTKFITINELIELEPRLDPNELLGLDDKELNLLKESEYARKFKVEFDTVKKKEAQTAADAKIPQSKFQKKWNYIKYFLKTVFNGICKKRRKQGISYHKEEGTHEIIAKIDN